MASLAAPALAAAARKPNIVFISSDDHHFQALGAAGNPNIKTPHLDRLASRGANFVNGQISTPQCAPSRGVLLTGRETFQTGLVSNGQTSFREGTPTVVGDLKKAGYQTTVIGKWHIRNSPAECGFAEAPLWLRAGGSMYRDPALCRGLDGEPGEVPGHITDLFTDAAISSIRGTKQPHFLWLAYNAPHTPWFADDRYQLPYRGKETASLAPPLHPAGGKPFDWNTYYAVITHLDEAIGRLCAEFDRRKAWNDTYVFFIGDNGFMCGTRGINGKVVPWEESVRVPMIAAGGRIAKGTRPDCPAASIDLPATWLDLAGAQPSEPVFGRSLRGVLETGKGGPAEGFSVWDDGLPSALAVKQAVEPYRQVRTRTHKLTLFESGRQEAYSHAADFAETKNLVNDGASTAVVDDLRSRLRARMTATADHAADWWTRKPGSPPAQRKGSRKKQA